MKGGAVLVGLIVVVSMSAARAAHFVCGPVNAAIDCADPGWRDVQIYYSGDEGNVEECQVSPENNIFCCDAESIPGHTWQIGDEIFARVVDQGDGYTAGPVSVVTTEEGFDVMPSMQLMKAGIVQDPSYPNCPDSDGDFINDASDNCPSDYNVFQQDADTDGFGDVCDNCSLANPGQEDCNSNSVGDVCDLASSTGRDCNANSVPDECDGLDWDGRGVVDLADHAAFTGELPGPGVILPCPFFDTGGDDNVDLKDFLVFQSQFGGGP